LVGPDRWPAVGWPVDDRLSCAEPAGPAADAELLAGELQPAAAATATAPPTARPQTL